MQRIIFSRVKINKRFGTIDGIFIKLTDSTAILINEHGKPKIEFSFNAKDIVILFN